MKTGKVIQLYQHTKGYGVTAELVGVQVRARMDDETNVEYTILFASGEPIPMVGDAIAFTTPTLIPEEAVIHDEDEETVPPNDVTESALAEAWSPPQEHVTEDGTQIRF